MLLKIPDTLTLDTPEAVRALRDVLDAYLRLFAPTTAVETPEVPVAPSLPSAPQTPPQTVTMPAPIMGPLYRQALEAAGGTASLDEILTQFDALGFVSKAKNPKDAIHTYLRHHDNEFSKLPPDEQGVTRWTVKGEA